MTSYWIADPTGVHALVEGEEQRDLWTGHYGWSLTGEPGPGDRVWITNTDSALGAGCIPFGAIAGGWDEQGWAPGPPIEPVVSLKDPAPAAAPAKKTKAAAGGKSEEK